VAAVCYHLAHIDTIGRNKSNYKPIKIARTEARSANASNGRADLCITAQKPARKQSFAARAAHGS